MASSSIIKTPDLGSGNSDIGGTTRMTIRYLADLPLYESVQPYVLNREPPPGIPRSNVTLIPYNDVIVTNARGLEDNFSLDNQGFQFSRFPLHERLDCPDSIERHLSEVQSFLQQLFNTKDVRIYEYKVRYSKSAKFFVVYFYREVTLRSFVATNRKGSKNRKTTKNRIANQAQRST